MKSEDAVYVALARFPISHIAGHKPPMSGRPGKMALISTIPPVKQNLSHDYRVGTGEDTHDDNDNDGDDGDRGQIMRVVLVFAFATAVFVVALESTLKPVSVSLSTFTRPYRSN